MTKEELWTLRTTHGLTQRALAELLGYHPNYVARLERGEKVITQRFEKLIRLLLGRKKGEKYTQTT
jgi:transcriptional regulator with XRE-family HTH domain